VRYDDGYERWLLPHQVSCGNPHDSVSEKIYLTDNVQCSLWSARLKVFVALFIGMGIHNLLHVVLY